MLNNRYIRNKTANTATAPRANLLNGSGTPKNAINHHRSQQIPATTRMSATTCKMEEIDITNSIIVRLSVQVTSSLREKQLWVYHSCTALLYSKGSACSCTRGTLREVYPLLACGELLWPYRLTRVSSHFSFFDFLDFFFPLNFHRFVLYLERPFGLHRSYLVVGLVVV